MGKTFRKNLNEILVSEVFSRYSRGGFLTGDVLVLKPGYEKMPSFKALPDQIKTAFTTMASSPDYVDKYLRVMNTMPVNPPVNTVTGANASTIGSNLEVMFELSPGMYNNVPFVLPSDIFTHEEYSATGYMSPKVADSLKYKFGDGKATEAPAIKHKASYETPDIPQVKDVASKK